MESTSRVEAKKSGVFCRRCKCEVDKYELNDNFICVDCDSAEYERNNRHIGKKKNKYSEDIY